MIKPITVLAGKKLVVNVQGRFVRIRESSSAFDLRIGSDVYTLEGGDEVVVRETDGDFKQLTFTNLSATDDLLVDFFAGKNLVRSAYVKLPRTYMVGREVDSLANHGTQDFAGVDDNGKRRKQFTLTMRPALANKILVRDADSGELLAIVGAASSGSGFAIETDANLQIQNETGGAIDNITDPQNPDVAVAETFYR